MEDGGKLFLEAGFPPGVLNVLPGYGDPAGEAIARYQGWGGGEPAPPRIAAQRASFRAARAAGVVICAGSDAGVFDHGENARELELIFERDLEDCVELRAETWAKRGSFHKLKDHFFYLFNEQL